MGKMVRVPGRPDAIRALPVLRLSGRLAASLSIDAPAMPVKHSIEVGVTKDENV